MNDIDTHRHELYRRTQTCMFAHDIAQTASYILSLSLARPLPSLFFIFTGAAIAKHPDISKVAFTGSEAVGHMIVEMSGQVYVYLF